VSEEVNRHHGRELGRSFDGYRAIGFDYAEGCRAVVLCALAIALRFLAVLMSTNTQIGGAYSSLPFATESRSARLVCDGPQIFGMSHLNALTNWVALANAKPLYHNVPGKG